MARSYVDEISGRSNSQERAMKYGMPTSMTDRSISEKVTFSPIRKDIMIKFEEYFNIRVMNYTGVDHEMHKIIAQWYSRPRIEVPLQMLMNKGYIIRLPNTYGKEQ